MTAKPIMSIPPHAGLRVPGVVQVCKVLYPSRKEEKLVVSVFASLQPLARCPTCTLLPPCLHIREDQLRE